MRKIVLVALLALAIAFATGGVAWANYGPHGGYAQDTDACAGCHRAHTSFSTLTWTGLDGVGDRSALLVSNASTMKAFCYACHGDAAPGASTNVQSGVYDGGPTTASGASINSTSTFYRSYSSAGALLNGGGFEDMNGASIQSSHLMDDSANAGILIKWGNANLAPMSKFTCTDCHDPHGSSNYRLLKDNVDGDKTNWVISNEEQFPVDGFARGAEGAADMAAYVPNYTAPYYAKSADADKGMSGWCAGCHSNYEQGTGTAADPNATYDYAAGGNPFGAASWSAGAKTFHRHPIGVTLAQGQGSERALNVELIDDSGLPLEMGLGQYNGDVTNYMLTKPWDERGAISCLTCHRAHGSSATATGWAISSLDASGKPTLVGMTGAQESAGGHGAPGTAVQGTNPGFSESMLRYPNRGVCERCHNK